MSHGKTLQENAEQFFDKIFDKHKEQMSCAKGCAKCCHTDISIFTWEAELIVDWFMALGESEKNRLKSLWLHDQQKGEDQYGKEAMPCTFLYDNACSIYEARPIICRTQGAPLFVNDAVDACPLNFTEHFPQKTDWLELSRLNTLSSLVQMNFEAGYSFLNEERIELKDLRKILSIL